MKKSAKREIWNSSKGVNRQDLFLKILLLPAILMLDLARAILKNPFKKCFYSQNKIYFSAKTKTRKSFIANKTLITALTIFIALSMAITVVIAVPATINLQGKLISASGSALSGTYEFTFRIYDAYTGGNLLYESNNTLTSDSRGLYHVGLRDINLIFDQQYYLAVKIDSDDEMTPRINLSSMPYAFRANTSDDLNPNNTYTISILNVTSNVTLGHSAADRITITSSNLNVSRAGNLDMGGNLTLAEKIKFSLSSVIENLVNNWLRITGSLNVTQNLAIAKNLTVNNSDLFVDSNLGRIGINTTTPTQTFTVVGDFNVTGRSYGIDTNESARFDNLTSYDCPSGELVIGIQDNGSVLCALDQTGGVSKKGEGIYLYNDSTVMYLNETKLNSTIDLRDKTIGNCSVSNSCSEIIYATNTSWRLGNCSSEASCSLITYDSELVTVLGDYWNMSKENLGWANLTDYPGACTSGDFVTQLADTLICSTPSYIGNCSIDGSCDNIVYESLESSLNVNSSNYWDSYNIPTDLNNLLTLHWDNVTNRPSDCGAGDFVRGIDGTALDCATPSYTTDTNCSAMGSCSEIYYYQGLNAANITSGNLDIARMPPGGSWSLSSDLNIDSNTLVVDYDADKVGIGTTTPNSELTVIGTVNATSFIGDGSQLTGISGSRWNLSGTNLYPEDLAYNVGIGTTTPTQKLEVSGHINVTGTSANSSFAGDVTIKGTLHGGSPLKISGGINLTSGNLTDNNGTVLTVRPGMIAIFDADCPTGWTRVTALDEKFLVGNSSYSAAAGGSDSVTLSVDNLPSHTHSFTPAGAISTPTFTGTAGTTSSDGAHTHSIDPPSTSTSTAGAHTHSIALESGSHTASGGPGEYRRTGSGLNTGSAGSHSHTVDIAPFTSGSAGAHTHSFTPAGTISTPTFTGTAGTTAATGSGTAFDNRPSYASVIICKKDIGSDYAEWIKSKEQYKPGTIVSADPNAKEQIKISEKAYDSAVLGVISTTPGWIVGMEDDDSLMMALSGRVPAMVAIKNEAIKPGDPITTSALPGIGMKATKPGSIVGKALESFEARECKDISSLEEITWLNDEDCFKLPDGTYISKITVLVSVSYWEPENYEEEQNEKIETNTETIKGLKQQIKDQQAEIEQLKAIVCLDHPEASICSSKVNTTDLVIAEREPDITEDEGNLIEQSTENLPPWKKEYPEIKEMFRETGSTLESVLENKGYKVTRIERSKGVKEGFEAIYKNYALVAIEREGLENIFSEGNKISEEVIPYIKSYYPASDIWIIFIHDTNPEGNQLQCIYSTSELNIGGCTSTPSWDLIFTEQEVTIVEPAPTNEPITEPTANTSKGTEAPTNESVLSTNETENLTILIDTNKSLVNKSLTEGNETDKTSEGWYHIINEMSSVVNGLSATITSSGLINYITLFLLI